MKTWKVFRNAGRAVGGTYSWRLVGEWADADVASFAYREVENKMRRGGVKLVRPDGRTEFIRWADKKVRR